MLPIETRPVSPLLRRIVDAIPPGESLRKTDIAKKVGIGRGSASKAVDALHSKGLLVAVEDGRFSVPAPAPRKRATIESRILDIMKPGEPIYVRDILKRFDDVKESSVSVQIVRMTHQGRIRQVARGLYVVADTPPPVEKREDLHATVFAMPPGHVFDVPTLSRTVGFTLSAASLAMRRLILSGMVVNISRGRYARTGAEPELKPTSLQLTTIVRRTMAEEDRVWSTREIQAVLDLVRPGANAAWVLNNMLREGHLERVVRGRWRLVRKGDGISANAFVARTLSVEMTRSVHEFLSQGGLHTTEAIAAAVGGTLFVTHSILKESEREGLVTRFLDRRWKWSASEDCACPDDGSLDKGRVAQRLVEIGTPVRTRLIIPSHTRNNNVTRALRALVQAGIAERVDHLHHRIAPRAWEPLSKRLAAAPRKRLSHEDHLAFGLFGDMDALTVDGLAGLAEIGVGKAMQVIERLQDAHRLVEVEPGLYMAC